MSVRSVLTAIADAIRVKTGESGTMKLEQMPAKIAVLGRRTSGRQLSHDLDLDTGHGHGVSAKMRILCELFLK